MDHDDRTVEARCAVSKYRVWELDGFRTMGTEERDDAAWSPPDSLLGIATPEEAAEAYADEFHQQGAHESTWPIVFVVHDGERWFSVEVTRDFDPVFMACRAKDLEDSGFIVITMRFR